ncbi:NADP-dependent phosphogluconate dehydrogenase, partial [Gilvimarinus sp. 1_MG-2023]|nr:NADP-dependent phosphogluconate dehydrogenase [Gilvimarinus sp. 1_MG-2023]
MKELHGMSADEIHQLFAEWNKTALDSSLVEISRDLLEFTVAVGVALVEMLLVRAGHHGTGIWPGVD